MDWSTKEPWENGKERTSKPTLLQDEPVECDSGLSGGRCAELRGLAIASDTLRKILPGAAPTQTGDGLNSVVLSIDRIPAEAQSSIRHRQRLDREAGASIQGICARLRVLRSIVDTVSVRILALRSCS